MSVGRLRALWMLGCLCCLPVLRGCEESNDPPQPPPPPPPPPVPGPGDPVTQQGELVEIGGSYWWVDPDSSLGEGFEVTTVSQPVHVAGFTDDGASVIGQLGLVAPVYELHSLARYADTGNRIVPCRAMNYIVWKHPSFPENWLVAHVCPHYLGDGEWGLARPDLYPNWEGEFWEHLPPGVDRINPIPGDYRDIWIYPTH